MKKLLLFAFVCILALTSCSGSSSPEELPPNTIRGEFFFDNAITIGDVTQTDWMVDYTNSIQYSASKSGTSYILAMIGGSSTINFGFGTNEIPKLEAGASASPIVNTDLPAGVAFSALPTTPTTWGAIDFNGVEYGMDSGTALQINIAKSGETFTNAGGDEGNQYIALEGAIKDTNGTVVGSFIIDAYVTDLIDLSKFN
jgi:hypothetical protein